MRQHGLSQFNIKAKLSIKSCVCVVPCARVVKSEWMWCVYGM